MFSQQRLCVMQNVLSCLCKCKDTKLKAIHNSFLLHISCYCDCSLGFYSVFCIVGEWFYMKDLLKFLFWLAGKTYFSSFLIRNIDKNTENSENA